MTAATPTRSRRRERIAANSAAPVDRRLRAFLAGETEGEDVLNALYGSPLHEPVPARLRDLLKRSQS